jgi:soluble lytic murein transglycosylase-like protein
MLIDGPSDLRNVAKGRGYLALAAQLGHQAASQRLDEMEAVAPEPDDCADFESAMQGTRFDMRRYIAGLPVDKRSVAELIRRDAEKFSVPPAFALAIACAESNFEARAVSPKNAQGVMQLIPDTQKRFGVSQPFDPRQNVQGGLRYLRWLLGAFQGNMAFVAAAYNAGEGAVQRHRGVPPFSETRAYVRRVLFYAGMAPGFSKKTAASEKRRQTPRM